MKVLFPAFALALVSLSSTAVAEPDPIEEVATEGLNRAGAGFDFMIRSYTKTDLCLSDDGATLANEKKFTYTPCGENDVDQLFVWDMVNNKLKSANKAGLCAKHVPRSRRSPAHFTLDECSSPATTLVGNYDLDKLRVQFNRRCLDDTGSWGYSSDRINTKQCEDDDDNQKFFFQGPSSQIGSDYFTRPTPIVFKMCSTAQPLFCLADTTGVADANPSAADPLEMLTAADVPYNEASWFVYTWSSQSIRSWKKPSLCITSAITARTPWVLETCDPSNPHQKFVYNDYIKLLHKWADRSKCLTTLQPLNAEAKTVSTATCNLKDDRDQQLDIVELVGQDADPKPDPCAKVVSRSLRKVRKQRK